MLRSNIQKIIQGASSPSEAAKMVCFWIDDQVGLYGNGWFDDDEVMTKLLEEKEDSGDRSYEEISSRVALLLSQ